MDEVSLIKSGKIAPEVREYDKGINCHPACLMTPAFAGIEKWFLRQLCDLNAAQP